MSKMLAVTTVLLGLMIQGCSSSDFSRSDRAVSPAQPPPEPPPVDEPPPPPPPEEPPPPSEHRDEFEQINYETKESALTNGVKGRLVDEAIQQGHNKLDLLLMIDTSGSMRQEQENLSARLGPLLSHIADSDWQISIVASGVQNNSDCFRALIKKSDPDAEAVYRSQVTAGTNGYTFEHGIRNALLGLKGECPNGQTPWVRDGSTLSVLFVSDEDDCSKGTCPDQVDWRTEIVNHVNSIREIGKNARFYGLIWEPGTQCDEAKNEGNTYYELIHNPLGLDNPGATSGKSGSICAEDYTPTLEGISKDISNLIKSQFDLKEIPDPNSVAIKVNGEDWVDFEVQDQGLVFSQVPPAESEITIQYTVGKSGEQVTETVLEFPPILESIAVTVDGNPLPGDQFEYQEAENKVVFKTEFGDEAKIKVTYQQTTELVGEFGLTAERIIADSIKISIDETPYEGEWIFDVDSRKISILPPPPAGSKIVVEYQSEPES